jgi:hypothetical protein
MQFFGWIEQARLAQIKTLELGAKNSRLFTITLQNENSNSASLETTSLLIETTVQQFIAPLPR